MRHSDTLFSLIKTLNKTEKGYFKRHALTHGKSDSNYVLLFNAMDKQEEYDEANIKKRFAGKNFLRHFSVTKNYLYHLVLKSMELYRQTSSIDAQVRSLLTRADFLYEKTMYKECEDMLEKAKSISEKYELYYFILEALHLKRILAIKKLDFEKLNLINSERNKYLEKIENIKGIETAHDTISFHFYTQGKKNRSLPLVKRLINNSLLKSEKNAKTFVSKRRFLDCYIYYNALCEDSGRTYEYARKKALLYITNPQMIHYDTYNYLVSLNAVIYGCTLFGKRGEHTYWIGQLREAEKYVLTKTNAVYYFYLNLHILHYNNTAGNFQSSVQFIKDFMLEKLNAYRGNMNDREFFVLYMNIANSYFGINNYSETLAWLNKIKNEIKMESDPDPQCFYRIFYLIVHFELKNYDLIPYLVKSTYRFLHKMDRLDPFQKVFINFLWKILKNEFSQRQIKKLFISFKNDLQKTHKRSVESQTAEYFDYISWLESKIEKRSFSEVVRGKALK